MKFKYDYPRPGEEEKDKPRQTHIGLPIRRQYGPNEVYIQELRWSSGTPSSVAFFFQNGVLMEFSYHNIPTQTVTRIISSLRLNDKEAIARARNTDISKWQEYRNTKYGFSFKYPEQWNVLDNPYEKDPLASGLQIGIWAPDEYLGYMGFGVVPQNCVSLDVCFNDRRAKLIESTQMFGNSPYFRVSPYEGTTTIAGEAARYLIMQYAWGERWNYYVIHNGQIVVFSFDLNESDQYSETVKSQIIQSVNFE
jgi:hypothetical protein